MNENQAITDKLSNVKSNSYVYQQPSKFIHKNTTALTSSNVLDMKDTSRKQSFILPSLKLSSKHFSEYLTVNSGKLLEERTEL
jgi:hypothetical protein